MLTNLKRTRGASHRKKETLAASIKIENAAIAKKSRLSKRLTRSITSSKKCEITDVNDEDNNQCTVIPTAVVQINSPPLRRKTLDSYYKVTNQRLTLSFRSSATSDNNYTNMTKI